MATEGTEKPDQGFKGKRIIPQRIVVQVRNDATKAKITEVDFSFLYLWVREDIRGFVEALTAFSRSQASSTPIYSVRKVLAHWKAMPSLEHGVPITQMTGRELERRISDLRFDFFDFETTSGLALHTTYGRWTTFLSFLIVLAEKKVISPVRVGSPALIPPPMREVIAIREDSVASLKNLAPKGLDHEGDSYNDELFESLSITRSDAEYITEYTERLGLVVDEIKKCALEDFSMLKEKRRSLPELLSRARSKPLTRLINPIGKRVYIDPYNGCHLLDVNGGHPLVLENLLYVVQNEMGGIPKQHFSFGSDGLQDNTSDYPHWHYVSTYGKNNLLPYLGVMNAFALSVCLVLLLIEMPGINATSLIRAKLKDKNGREVLIDVSGENDYEIMTVDKPRANAEKISKITDLAREVLDFVLDWTRPVREEMIKEGRLDDASWLWVGMSRANYNFINYSQKTAFNALKLDDRYHPRATIYKTSREESFVERHVSLAPWAKKITFKALRVNVGVLVYLRTGGDLVATAKAFGHKNIETTIANYLPRPLRLAMYERQIRRHQNYLIVSALEDEEMMLRVSDFKTVEELHVFLASQPVLRVDPKSEEYLRFDLDAHASQVEEKGRIMMSEDTEALALALLYGDHLNTAPSKFLDTPDKVTGVVPRFWIEFAQAISGPLPLAMSNIENLVQRAIVRKNYIATKIRFPDFSHGK